MIYGENEKYRLLHQYCVFVCILVPKFANIVLEERSWCNGVFNMKTFNGNKKWQKQIQILQ